MVGLQTFITLGVVGALALVAVYFRKELYQTAQYVGGGLSSLAAGISDIGSVQIRPALVPSVGFNVEGALASWLFPGSDTPGGGQVATQTNQVVTPANRETSDITATTTPSTDPTNPYKPPVPVIVPTVKEVASAKPIGSGDKIKPVVVASPATSGPLNTVEKLASAFKASSAKSVSPASAKTTAGFAAAKAGAYSTPGTKSIFSAWNR